MQPKAVFFDVDGTLVSFDTHRVPESAAEAVRRLREQGILTFLATGRMPRQISIVGDLPFDGYITYNGAACFDAAWRPISRTPLPEEDVRRALHYLDRHELTLSFMYADSVGINRIDEHVVTALGQCGEELPAVRDPHDALLEPVYQANIYVGPEQEAALMRDVFTGSSSSRWHPLFADINARGVNKQTGMDHLLAHFGLSPDQTMAFGDGGNDLPMLRHAGIGVAMGNARDEVKQQAGFVTRSVDDDGIAHALHHFGLL